MKRENCMLCGDMLMRITEGGENRYICSHCGMPKEVLDILDNHKEPRLTSGRLVEILKSWIGDSDDMSGYSTTVVIDDVEIGLLTDVIKDKLELKTFVYYNDRPLSSDVRIFRGSYDLGTIFLNTLDIARPVKAALSYDEWKAQLSKSMYNVTAVCPNCNGHGVVLYSGHEKCEPCDGTGIIHRGELQW